MRNTLRDLTEQASPSRLDAAHVGPATQVGPPVPLRFVVERSASGKKWIARLDDRVLCRTAWPFVMSARLLLAEGYPVDAVAEMWRPDTDEWALRGRLGAVAATVIDGERSPRRAKNGSPVCDPMRGASACAAGLRSSLGRFWRAAHQRQ